MLTPTPSGMQAVGSGVVTCSITEGIATVSFYHPKSNSLPASLLSDIAGRITAVSKHPATRVVVIRSEGTGSFCAGATFAGLALDADWRDAEWCVAHGLYTRVCDNQPALDQVLNTLSHRLATFN